jgi:hypothetical protein
MVHAAGSSAWIRSSTMPTAAEPANPRYGQHDEGGTVEEHRSGGVLTEGPVTADTSGVADAAQTRPKSHVWECFKAFMGL